MEEKSIQSVTMMNDKDTPPNVSSNTYPEMYKDLTNDNTCLVETQAFAVPSNDLSESSSAVYNGTDTATTVKEVCNESQSIHDQIQPIVKEISDGEPSFLQFISRKRKRNGSIFNIQNLQDMRSSQVEPISPSIVTVLKYRNGEFVEVQSSSTSYNCPMSLKDMRKAITASLESCISQPNIELKPSLAPRRDSPMNVEQTNYSIQQVPVTQVEESTNEKPEPVKKSPPATKPPLNVKKQNVLAVSVKKIKSPTKESIKFANRQKELMKLKKEMRKKSKLEPNEACDLMNIAGHVWCRTIGVMCTMCGNHVQKSYGCFRRDNAPEKLMYLFTPGMNRIKICRRCLPYKKPAVNPEDSGKKTVKKPWVKYPGGNDAPKTHVIIKHKLQTKIEPRENSHDKPVSTATIDAIHRKITAANEPPDATFMTSPKIVLGETGKGQAMDYIKKLAENLKANYDKEVGPTGVQPPLSQEHVTSLTPITSPSSNIIQANITNFTSSGNTKETGSNLMTTQWTPLVLKQGSPLVTSSNIIQASVRPSVPQGTGASLMSTISPNIQASFKPSAPQETGSNLMLTSLPNLQATVKPSAPQETGSNLMLTSLPNLQATVQTSAPQETRSNLILTSLPNLQATVQTSAPQETGSNLMLTSLPNLQATVQMSAPQETGSNLMLTSLPNLQATVKPSAPQETGSNLMLTSLPNLQATVRLSAPQETGSSLLPTPPWTPLSLVVQQQPLKIASLATMETASDITRSKQAQTFGKTNSNKLQTIPAIVVSSHNAVPGSGSVLLQIQRVKLVRERVGESKEGKSKFKLDEDSVGGKPKRGRPVVCVSCKSNVVKSYRCINQYLSPPKLQHLFNNEREVQIICRKCLNKNGGALPPREKDLIGGKSLEDNECPGIPVDQVEQREEQCEITKVKGELCSIEDLSGTPRDTEDLSGTPRDTEDPACTPRDTEDLSGTPRDIQDLSGTPRDIQYLSDTPRDIDLPGTSRDIEESTTKDSENNAILSSVKELTGTMRDTARISNMEDIPDINRESVQTVASIGNHGDEVKYPVEFETVNPVNMTVDDSESIVDEEDLGSGEIKPLGSVGGLGMSYETSQSEFLFGTNDVIGSVVSIETAGDNDGHQELDGDDDGLEGADILGEEGVVLDTGIQKDNEGTLEHDGQRKGSFGDVLIENENDSEKSDYESELVIDEDVTDEALLNQNSFEELGAMVNLEGLTYDYRAESWSQEAVSVQMEMNDVKINDIFFSEGSEETSCEEDDVQEKRESEFDISGKKNKEDESGDKSIAEEEKRKVGGENEISLSEADQDDIEDKASKGEERKMDNERMDDNEKQESNVQEIDNEENMNNKGMMHKEEKLEGNKEKMNNEEKKGNEEKMNSEGKRGNEEKMNSEGKRGNEEKMNSEGKRGNEEKMNSEVKEEITQSEGTEGNEEKIKDKTPESRNTKETEKSESLKKVKATNKKSAPIEDEVVKENDKRLRQRRAVASPRKSPVKNENKVEIEYKTRGALLKKQKEAESASEESQNMKRKNEEKKPVGRGRKKPKLMEDDAGSVSSGKKPKQVNKKPKQQKTTSKPVLQKEKQEKIEQP